MVSLRSHTAHTGRLSRSERTPAALSTTYFQLDERSRAQLIRTATALARHMTYFDAQNRGHGPREDGQGAWEAFFRHDVTFLLAEIATVDPKADFRDAQTLQDLPAHVDRLVSETRRLWSWRDRAREMAIFAPPDSLVSDVAHTLEQPDETELTGAPFAAIRDAVEGQPIEARLAPVDVFGKMRPDSGLVARTLSVVNRATARIVDAAECYLTRALAERRDHPGHLGLFLAFVELMEKTQADLNRMTDRHLEFYFRQVLRSQPQAPHPDSTYVTFELAPGARSVVLEAGTALVSGQGQGPESGLFELDRSVEVTAARLAHLRVLSVQRNPERRTPGGGFFVEAVNVYPVADSADGRGAPLADPEVGWSPFGPRIDAPAEVGFALAAPILELAGGQREITVALSFDPKADTTLREALCDYKCVLATRYHGVLDNDRVAEFLAEALDVSLSMQAGWLPVPDLRVRLDPDMPDLLQLTLAVPATAPPVAAWRDVHAHPVLRVLLNPDARVYGYSSLHRLRVSSAEITVKVRDLTALKLETDIAPVAPGKPFAPFGPIPLPRARLTLTAPELALKTPDALGLKLFWTGLPLPPDTFASHYAGYAAGCDETAFRARLDQSDGAGWQPLPVQGPEMGALQKDAALFELDEKGAVATETQWHVPSPPETVPRGAAALSSQVSAGPDTRPRGTLRLELTSPRFGFGQRLYPELLTAEALRKKPGPLGKALKSITPKALSKQTAPPPPKPPLLPLLTGVGLSYAARARSDALRAGAPVELYNLRALGDMTRSADRRLLRADLDVDAYLMIGLDGTRLPETVSLFFEMRDSLAEAWMPGDPGPRPQVSWTYLTEAGWRPVPPGSLREETTRGLTTSGVVEIALPQTAIRSDRYGATPLVWLSAALRGTPDRFGRIVRIIPHGVRATRRLTTTHAATGPSTPDLHLPAGKITRFHAARPAIAKITQPVPSRGGRHAETDAAFRLRLSERLGHKMRAQRPLDYARMVLQEFDEIGDIRVLPDDAGGVEVVVAPRRHAGRGLHAPRVPLHLRAEIAAWLAARTSLPVARIDVRNPAYETLRVQARLVPRAGGVLPSVTDVVARVGSLIAPWMDQPQSAMPIGAAQLDAAGLLQELRALPGLEDVLGFSVLHVFRHRRANRSAAGAYGFKDSARVTQAPGADHAAILLGATPASVFIPARRHLISILSPREGIGDLRVGTDLIAADPARVGTYRQDPATLPLRAAPAGIGSLAIGEDFIVTRPEDTLPPAFAPDTRHHALDAVFLAK